MRLKFDSDEPVPSLNFYTHTQKPFSWSAEDKGTLYMEFIVIYVSDFACVFYVLCFCIKRLCVHNRSL